MGCGKSKEAAESTAATKQVKKEEKKGSNNENNSFKENMEFLQGVNLFKRLPKDQHPLLAAACQSVEFKAGASVIKQGDPGSEFFVIKSGEAVVSISKDGQNQKVAVLKSGDYFGEAALLRDEPRTATITAGTLLHTLKITREKFQELGLHEKLQFANRKAVGAGGKTNLVTKPPTEKKKEDRDIIRKALENNENLNTMVTLDDARIKEIIDVAWREEIAPKQVVIQEGDLQADYFYMVQEGSFEVFIAGEDEGKGKLGAKPISTITKGGSFGELALLYLVPRAASVVAKDKGVVWVIDRNQFKNILLKVSEEKAMEYMEYLERVSILEALLSEEKKALAMALVEMHFGKGEIILEQGEQGSTFYILYEGEVQISKDGANGAKLKASSATKIAHFFGEKALMSNEPRAATITVISNEAKALALDRESFNMLIGPLEDIIKQQEAGIKRESALQGQHKGGGAQQRRDRILRKDLVRIGLLGCGGFGAVELWEHRDTKDTYAMKGLSKGFIVKQQMQESVMNEKNILLMTNSSFITKLYETYNGSQTLYFLLEPALGGELYATYNRKGFHGSEKHARFYIAGTVLAFEHMHERRIIYRDLKPENVLLSELGQTKLTDMGLAKFVVGKTFTTCGTPDYFAPELIASTGHTNAVDWWTLGILLFELMAGHPPFESAYPMQIYSKVMKGISKIPMPPKCQGPVGDLIKAVLRKEPSERLPMRPGGIKNLKEHRWFITDLNWDAMASQKVEPPYKPVVKSKRDIANFVARKEDMPQHLEYKDDGSGWDKDFAS
eukprot:TRINITY_DN8139_c0_g1_i1.p1 TRINITY_DN8139_c0_g1~~TRINITY_DN8139_c0_g1_i1.p1  ORF type:complete len:787 (-),score=197.12 TRINITY_DN8139_c0_g1_i1:150-2510(-)